MSITGEALAGTFECYFKGLQGGSTITDIYVYIYVYICIENRWTFTGVFGVATAHLCPRVVQLAEGDDFLHEGVVCLPVAQVTVASDANKFHHILHRPRHIVV